MTKKYTQKDLNEAERIARKMTGISDGMGYKDTAGRAGLEALVQDYLDAMSETRGTGLKVTEVADGYSIGYKSNDNQTEIDEANRKWNALMEHYAECDAECDWTK